MAWIIEPAFHLVKSCAASVSTSASASATMYAMVVAAVLMLAVAEEGGGEGGPNCRGCFNETSGVCVLDTDPGGDPTCPLATPTDCAAIGLPYLNNSLDIWPKGDGCLAEVVAEGKLCMSVLEQHGCSGGALHAPNQTACAEMALKRGASYIGWIPTHEPPGLTAENCLIVTGEFAAGCAGCEGCEYWTYTELESGETRHSCAVRCRIQLLPAATMLLNQPISHFYTVSPLSIL